MRCAAILGPASVLVLKWFSSGGVRWSGVCVVFLTAEAAAGRLATLVGQSESLANVLNMRDSVVPD